jgi:flagellar biogenesis protein FliO
MKKNAMPSINTNNRALDLPVLTDEVALRSLRAKTGLLSRFRAWIEARRLTRCSDRRLRVAETVSLGEKRFVAVVQVDGRHFLLAGGPANIVLLAQLQAEDDFQAVLSKTMTVPDPPAKQKPASAGRIRSKRKNVSQKSAGTTGKNQAKRTAKSGPSPSDRAGEPLPAASNTTTAFGDLLNAIPVSSPLAKPGPRQNGKYTPGNPEEYA